MSDTDNIQHDIGGREGIFVPIYVTSTGQYGRTPNTAIIDIAGIHSPNFTVGGKPLMFADGSSTDGLSHLDFQSVYLQTRAINGAARISLTPGKDFAICDADGNSYVDINSNTGKITIHGEMAVVSAIAKFEGAYQEFNHLNVLSTDGNRTALLIEPKAGVEFLTNPVQVKTLATGPIDFSINPQGQTYIRDLIVDSINADLLGNLDFSEISAHLSPNASPYKHLASEIEFQPQITNVRYVHFNDSISVNDALNSIIDSLSNKLETVSAAIDLILQDEQAELSFFRRLDDLETTVAGQNGLITRMATAENEIQHLATALNKIHTTNITGINFEQYQATTVWTIHHETGSTFIQFTTYDENERLIWPDEAFSLNQNTFVIVFGSNQSGRAILSCLIPPITTISQQ